MDASRSRALVAALDKEIAGELFKNSELWDIQVLLSKQDFDDNFDKYSPDHFDVLICGSSFGSDFANEFAQVMRQQAPSSKIYCITADGEKFNAAAYKKNGYTDAFLWPMDSSIAQSCIEDAVKAVGPHQKTFKSVFVSDLDAETKMPFETYIHMPLNKKYVRFSAKDAAMGGEKLGRLQQRDFGRLYIDKTNSESFYEYAALQLKETNSMTATERAEKVHNSVRNIFSQLLDKSGENGFEAGREFLADCQKIVSSYITSGTTSNWYSQMTRALGSALTSYDHAGSVSTIAALAAIGIGHPQPEDLALAGFFHDVGRVDLPEDLMVRPSEEWPKEIWLKYQDHPMASLNLIKERKILLTPEVEKAILQHHERFDGKGFPKQLRGDRITLEAQILSFADQMAYATTVREGVKRAPPLEAFESVARNGSLAPELVAKIRPLFEKKG